MWCVGQSPSDAVFHHFPVSEDQKLVGRGLPQSEEIHVLPTAGRAPFVS